MMTNTMGGCSGLPRYTVKSIMAPSMTHLINQGIECETKVCGHTVSSLKIQCDLLVLSFPKFLIKKY